MVGNEDVISLTGVGEEEFQVVCDREIAEIERRRQSLHCWSRARSDRRASGDRDR